MPYQTTHTTFTEAQQRFAELYERVTSAQAIVVIHREGAESVALISRRELEKMMETMHLLQSPENSLPLLTALNRSESWDVSTRFAEEYAKLDPRAEVAMAELGIDLDSDGNRQEY